MTVSPPASPVNFSSSDSGSAKLSTGEENAPQAARQKGILGNSSRHHRCQRSTVCRLTPTSFFCRRIRTGVTPQRIAVITVTSTARYTLRPRKISEAGVVRPRHPSFAQQKDCRQHSTHSMLPAAPRLASIARRVQPPLTLRLRASLRFHLRSSLLIQLLQYPVESDIIQHRGVHGAFSFLVQ